MDTRWTITGLIGILLLPLAGLAFGAAANVGQVDINISPTFETSWPCPPGSGSMVKGPFTAVPGLALSLTTSGGPVLLQINMTLHGSSGAGFWFEPLIDSQPMSNDRMGWQTGSDTEAESFTYSRVYSLPAGGHTFATEMSCQNEVLVYRAWLTVYELPTGKR